MDIIVVDPKIAWAQKKKNLIAEADKMLLQTLPAKSEGILRAREAFTRSSGTDIYAEKTGIDAEHYDRVCSQYDVASARLANLVHDIYQHGIDRKWEGGE